MSGARRCSRCGTNWPNDYSNFQICPDCAEETSFMANATPLDGNEATSRKKHADFERYYERRETERQAEIERLSAALERS